MKPQLRWTAILPLVATLVAFILSMLLLFAGSNVGMLEDMDLLTLNTSQIGQIVPSGSSNSSSEGKENCDDLDFVEKAKCKARNAGDSIDDAKDKVGETINDGIEHLSDSLGISDFYSVHVLNFCEGSYKDPTSGDNMGKNVSSCSNRTAFFNFDPKQAIEEKTGIDLSDVDWPEEIESGFDAVRTGSMTLYLFFVASALFTGLSLLACLGNFLSGNRRVAICEVAMELVGFLTLLIASAICTSIINNIVDTVNKYGDSIGVSAYRGSKFLGATWTATILMALAAVIEGVAGACLHRSSKKHKSSNV